MATTKNCVIVALDGLDYAGVQALLEQVRGQVAAFKVGSELFTLYGPDIVNLLRGERVFLDLKWDDIPNTVAAAVRAAQHLGVWMFNVHAKTCRASLRAAADNQNRGSMLGIGVTVLTSFPEDEYEARFHWPINVAAMKLTQDVLQAGLDGVVCSPHEVAQIKAIYPRCLAVVPGIRPAGTAANDQARIATPAEALRSWADYLVLGRPITAAHDPVAALASINAELQEVAVPRLTQEEQYEKS